MRDERRHHSFYRIEAERRLGASAGARRATRLALHHLWAIVGTGVRPQSETDFVVFHLFGGDEGTVHARRLDATIDTLPGLDGLHLFERAVTKATARARRLSSGAPPSGARLGARGGLAHRYVSS